MRQYIGARYVPFFFNVNGSNNWIPNYAYEPLIIVTYNNVSYISTQYVPASVGNPAENKEYWVATGNYNSFINQINKDIANIQDELTPLTNMKNLNGKYYLLMADSYAYWTNYLTSLQSILESLGAKVEAIYSRGVGINITGNTWEMLYNTAQNKGKYTDIVVLGLLNDATTFPSDQGASNTTLWASLYNIMSPDKKIALHLLPFGNAWGVNQIAQHTNMMLNYINYINALPQYGIRVAQNMQDVLHHNNLWQDDNYHPNANGANRIVVAVMQYLLGMDAEIFYPKPSNNIQYYVDKGKVHYNPMQSVQITNFTTQLTNFDQNCLNPTSYARYNGVVNLFTYSPSYRPHIGVLSYDGTNWYLYVPGFTEAYTATFAVSLEFDTFFF